MSSILKQMTSLYNRLQYVYAQGGIPYPRVANDYMQQSDLRFYEYPHPPFQAFDEYSKPLQEESYLLSKETLPLYLTHENISTPATLLKNIAYIDIYFDDNMMPRSNANGLSDALDEVMGMLREDAQEIYSKEVKGGTRNSIGHPEYLEDGELLSVISKDGDVASNFQMSIMPYTIVLEPYIDHIHDDKEKEEIHTESMDRPIPIEKPTAFKIFSCPSKNYKHEIVNDPIQIDNFNDLLILETIRQKNDHVLTEMKNVMQTASIKMSNAVSTELSEQTR